jgi:hypothetical protein
MTETTTPTDEVVDQGSSDIRDESLLDNSNEQTSAVEQRNDTDSGEQSQDSGSEQSSTKAEQSSDEDKGLAAFAKSQGFDDFDNLSEDAKKALRIARKQVQSDRKDLEEQANKRKVDQEVEGLYQPDENDDTNDAILKRMAIYEARDTTSRFWADNPDDKKYETKMAELLLEEKQKYGVEAAQLLAGNLPRLLREAKAVSGAYDSDAARDAGRREERERLKKVQEGSADSAHATQTSSVANKKLTREAVANMSDEEYVKRRDEIDAAIQRGDLY